MKALALLLFLGLLTHIAAAPVSETPRKRSSSAKASKDGAKKTASARAKESVTGQKKVTKPASKPAQAPTKRAIIAKVRPVAPISKEKKATPANSGKTGPSLTEEVSPFTVLTPDQRLQLQVFLDRAIFAPGKVDGMLGEFTLKAALRWCSAAPDRSLDALLKAARTMPVPATVLFTLPRDSTRYIGTVPISLANKSAAKSLPYTTLAEYVAERFHTDLATLARLNPAVKLDKLSAGDVLTVPNVMPFKIEDPRREANATRLVGAQLHISHDQHMLEVRLPGGALAASFPITVGSKPEHVRSGAWKVIAQAPNPTFTWDDEMLKNGRRGSKQYLLPPGPNNPVGVLWMELEPVSGPEAHIGIHGTNDPDRIGRNSSSGCIRLANWDVVRLARIIGPGTRVTWLPAASPLMVATAP